MYRVNGKIFHTPGEKLALQRAEFLAIKTDTLKGKYILKSQMRQEAGLIFVGIKRRLLAFPGKLARECSKSGAKYEDVHASAAKVVRLTLRELKRLPKDSRMPMMKSSRGRDCGRSVS